MAKAGTEDTVFVRSSVLLEHLKSQEDKLEHLKVNVEKLVEICESRWKVILTSSTNIRAVTPLSAAPCWYEKSHLCSEDQS